MEKNIDIELFEKFRRVSRAMKWMRHEHKGPMEGRGPCHPHMHHMPPEGEMPEAHMRPERPHHPRRLPRERILTILNERPEGVRQRELAEAMMINPSSISEAIDKLEADRYIERNVDPSDRRATLITLTEKGKARAYEVEDERAEAFGRFFRNLDEEEKAVLSKLLDKILSDETFPA